MSPAVRWMAYGTTGALLAYYGAMQAWKKPSTMPMWTSSGGASSNSHSIGQAHLTTESLHATRPIADAIAASTALLGGKSLSDSKREPSKTRRRVVAIGDLHGDLAQMKRVFHLMGIIDDKDNWAGGDYTTFVQTVSSVLIRLSPFFFAFADVE